MKFEDIEVEDVDFGAMLEESFKNEESKSDLINGVIVKINLADNQAIVNIGRKNESFLSLDELRDEDGELFVKEGDSIPLVITGHRDERATVSYKMAAQREALKEFIEDYDDTQEYIVEGVVTKKNKGGFIVEVADLEFFMPKTLSYFPIKINPIGKNIKALIVKVDKDKETVIISRKELIEREKAVVNEIVDRLLSDKTPVVGTVKKITTYGMFVDVGGMDGLVHYSQISYKGPVNPSKYYKEGDSVNVVAIDYDKKKKHLSLSIKDAFVNPWNNIDDILRKGDVKKATVSNIEPYGVFVDLGDELEAFLHVSEIAWDKNVKHPKDYLTLDEVIEVEIIEIDKEAKKLRVSRKNLVSKPIDKFASEHKVGEVVTGTISSITDFGAFVKVDAIEGLLHNQETSWDKSKNAKNLFKVGEEVEVKIIKIEANNGKISFSKKALELSPIQEFAKNHKNGDIVEGAVKDKKEFGIFINLGNGVDALIRLDDLAPLKEEEVVKGQVIKGVISYIDTANEKIRVSVKRLERQEEKAILNKVNKGQEDSMTLGDVFNEKFNK
ncbi:MAG: 30S ribosomal protein S1 [Sulfurovum sp. AS07-7]|jgi:small subunit ribosomal protein S1|nr:MAG: 30S ribosomal protein S1 [Sulfurovum sp. AS07-7]TQV63462.1 MAG: 30S ribosomal protein S1 [Sulfurovum sp.]